MMPRSDLPSALQSTQSPPPPSTAVHDAATQAVTTPSASSSSSHAVHASHAQRTPSRHATPPPSLHLAQPTTISTAVVSSSEGGGHEAVSAHNDSTLRHSGPHRSHSSVMQRRQQPGSPVACTMSDSALHELNTHGPLVPPPRRQGGGGGSRSRSHSDTNSSSSSEAMHVSTSIRRERMLDKRATTDVVVADNVDEQQHNRHALTTTAYESQDDARRTSSSGSETRHAPRILVPHCPSPPTTITTLLTTPSSQPQLLPPCQPSPPQPCSSSAVATDTLPQAATTSNSSNTRDVLPAVRGMTSTSSSSSLSQTTMTRTTSASSRSAARVRHRLSSHTGSSSSGVGTSGGGNDQATNVIGGVHMAGGMMRLPSTSASSSAELSPLPPMQLLPLTMATCTHDSNNNIIGDATGPDSQVQPQQHHHDREAHALQAAGPAATMTATQHITQTDSESHACTDEDNNNSNKKTSTAAAIVATGSTSHAASSVHDTQAAGTAVRSNSNRNSPPQAEQATNNNTTTTTTTSNNDAGEGEADRPRHAPRLSFKERLGAGCSGLPSRLTRGRTSLRATTTSTTTTTPTLTAVTTIMRNAGRSTPASPDISHAAQQAQTSASMHTATPSSSSLATATNLYRGYNPSTLTRSSAVLATSPMTHPFTTSSSTASCMTQRPSQSNASPLQQQAPVETSEAVNESSARSEAGKGDTQSITTTTTSNNTTASHATLRAQPHTATPPAPGVSTATTLTTTTTAGEIANCGGGAAQHVLPQLCEEQPMLQVDQLSADRPRAAELQTNSLTTTTNDSAAVATAERATSQSTCRYSQPSTPLAAPGTTCRSPRLMQTTNIITTPTSTRSPSSGTALHVADAAAHVTSSTTTTSNANMTTKSHSPAWHATRATTDYISTTTTTTPTLTPPPPPPPSGHHRLPSTNSAAAHSPRMRPKRRVWRAQTNLTGAMHAIGTITSTSSSSNIQPKDAGSRGAGGVARIASGLVHGTHIAPLPTTTSNAPLSSAHVSANASPLRQRRDRGKMLSRESSALLVSETLAMHARTASATTSVSASALADTVHLTDTLRSGGSTGSSNGGGNSARRHGQTHHPNKEANKESSERSHTSHDDDERRQHEGDMPHHGGVMGGSAMAARRVLFQSDSVNAECATIADTSRHDAPSPQKSLQTLSSSSHTVATADKTTTVTAPSHVVTTTTATTTAERDTTMPSSTVQQQQPAAAVVVSTTQSTYTPPTVATITTTTTSPSALRHSPPCSSPSVDERRAVPVDTSASTSNPSFSASSLSITATTMTTTAAAVTITTTTGHVDTTGGNTSHSMPPCHGNVSYQASHSPTRQGREHSVVHTVPSLLPHDTHTTTTSNSSDEDKTGTHSPADLSSTPLQLDPHHHCHNNNDREDNNDDTLAHTTGSMRTMALLAGSHSLVSSFHLAGLGATSSGPAAAKKDNGRVSSFSSLQFSVRPRPRRRIVASERRHGATTTTTSGHTSGPTRTLRAHRGGTAVRGSSSSTGKGKEEEKETRHVTPSAATAQQTTTTTTTQEARKDRTERTDAMPVVTTTTGVGSTEGATAHAAMTDAPHPAHTTTTSHAHRDRSRPHKTTTTTSSSSSSASAAGHIQQRRPRTAATLPQAEHASTTAHTHPTTTTTAIEMPHADSDNDRNNYEEEEHVSSDLDTLQQMAGDSLSASAIDELGMMSGDEAISGGGSAIVGVGMRESVTHVFLPVYELLLEANDTASESTTTTTVTANNSPRMSLRAESPFSPESHSYSIEPTATTTTMTIQGTLGGNAMGGTMSTPALRGRASEGAALATSPASPPPVATATTSNSRPLSRQSPQHSTHNNNNDDNDDSEAAALPSATDKSLLPMSTHGPTQSTKATTTTTAACGSPLPEAATAASPMYLPHSTASPPPMQSPPASSGLYSHHTCYYQALPPSALRPQASPYSANATAGSPPSAQLARASTMNSTAARLTPASSPLHAAGPLQLGSVAASYYCEPSAEPDPAVDCKIAARFVFDAQRGVLLIDPCHEVCRYMAQSELSSSRRCAMSGCGPCDTTISNGKAATAPSTDIHGGCSAACGDNVNKNDDENEEGDGACGCSADFIAKDVRGVDYSGYHAHELYDHCSLCQRRPAAFLCLHCLQAFCPSHVARHHAQDPANCTLFLNVLDILTCFQRIFWCERCKRFTWRYTDVYEPLVDQIVYTRGTYLTRPVHDMHCIGFEAQLHDIKYNNNNGSNDNVHATTSQDPTSSNSFSPYVLPAAMSSCPGTLPVHVPLLNERVTAMVTTPGTPRALDCTLNNMNTSGEGNAVSSTTGDAMLLPPSTALMHAMGSPRYHGTKKEEEQEQQERASSPFTYASQREQQHVVSALNAAHGTACELAQTSEAQPAAGRSAATTTTAADAMADTTTQAATGVVIVKEPNITTTGEGATGHATDNAQSQPTTTMPAARQRSIALGDPVTRLSALSASMQGWRSTQEDAATAFLITLPSFTASSSPSQRTQAGQSVTAQTTATTTTSGVLRETNMMSPLHDTPSTTESPATSQATQARTTLSAGSNDNERNDACSPASASAPLPPLLSSSSAATSPLVMDETDGTPMAVFCVFDGHGGDAVAKLAAEHFEFHLSQAMRRVRPEDSAAQALLRSVRSDSLGSASVRTPPLQQQQQEVTGRPLVSALNTDAVNNNNNNTTNVVVMGGAAAGRRGSVGSAVPSSAAASPMTLSTVYAASPTLTSTTTGTTTTTTNNAKDLLTPYGGSHHHHIQQQQQTTMTPSPPTLLASATTTTTTTGSEAGMTSRGGGHAVHVTSTTATAAADRGSGAAGLYGSFGSGRSGESGADFLAQSVPLQSNSPAKTDAVPTLDVSSTVQEHKGLSTPHITPTGIALLSDQTGSNTTCPTYRQTVHSSSPGEAVKVLDTAEAGQTPPQTQSMMGLPHVLPISPEQRLRQHISSTTSSVIPHEVAHSPSPAALRQNTAPRLRLRPCPVVSDVGHNAVVSGSLSKSNSGSSFAGKAACKDTLREERERLQPTSSSSPPRTFAVTHTSTPPIQPATSAMTRESTRQPSSLGYLSCLSPPPSLSSSSSPLYMRNATRGQQQHEDEGEEDEGGEEERLRSHAHSPHPAIPSPPQLHPNHTTTTGSMRADGARIATTGAATAPTPSPPLRATMTGSPALPHHSRQVPLLVQQPLSPSRVYVSAHEMTLLRDYFARIMTDALLSLDAFLQHTVEGERGDYGCVGCTACVVGITSHFILCANVGDSGAALYTPETIEMISVTQRVNQPKERNRILQAGYAIIEDRIEGLLAVPRALGDFDFKQCGGKTAAEQAVTAVPEVTIRPVPLRRTSAQPLPHSFSSSSSLPLAAATIERGGGIKRRHAEGSPDTTYNDNMGYNSMNVYNSHASGSGSNECEYGKWGVLVACDGVWDTATLHQVHYALTHTTNELDVASSATAAVLRGRECLREGLYCHDMPDNNTTAGAARQSPSHTAQSPPPLPSDTSFAARHTPDMLTKTPPTTTTAGGSGEDERHAPTTTTTDCDVVGADRQTVACPTHPTSAATLVTDNSNAVAAVTSHDEVSRGTQPMPYTSVADNNSHYGGSSAWHTPVLQRTQSSASPHAGLLGAAVEQAHTSQPQQQQQSVTEGLQRRRSGRMGSCAEAECGIDARLLTAAAGVFAQCIAPADNDEGIGLDNCSLILIERRAYSQ